MALHIPDNFEVGESTPDSYFDSVAQGLRQMLPDKTFTANSVRNDCKEFAKQHLPQENSWVKEELGKRSIEMQYYIEHIEHSPSEELAMRSESVICGCPEIEGKMLCFIHDIRIQILASKQEAGIFKSHSYESIEKTGCVTIKSIDYNAKDVIYLVQNDSRLFKPLLRKQCSGNCSVQQFGKLTSEPVANDKVAEVHSDSSDDDIVLRNSKMTSLVNGNKSERAKLNKLSGLIKKGVDINFIDPNRMNDTALHIAVRRRNLKVIEFLLDMKADVNAPNKDGQNCLQLAQHLEYLDAVDILESKCKASLENVNDNLQMEVFSADNAEQRSVAESAQKHSSQKMRETYTKRIGAEGASGHFFELNLLSLVKLRAENQTEEFYLAGSMDEVGAFDDVVLKYVDPDGKSEILFLQAKHKAGKIENITVGKLKSSDGIFGLPKYFQAFLDIKSRFEENSPNPIFQGMFNNLNCNFVIYTNAVLDTNFEGNRITNTYDSTSSILKMADFSKIFKLNATSESNNDIVALLAETARMKSIYSLANSLMKFISKGNFHSIMSDENIKVYHVLLAREVMTMKGSCTNVKSSLDWEFRDNFLENKLENTHLSDFRKAFFEAYAEYELVSGEKQKYGITSEDEITTACDGIVQLLLGSKSNTMKVEDIPDTCMDIICKLAGEILVCNKDSCVLQFSDEKRLVKNGAKLIAEIKKRLGNDLTKYAFDIRDQVIAMKLTGQAYSFPAEFGNVKPKFKHSVDQICNQIVELLGKYTQNNVCKIEKMNPHFAKDITKLVGNLFQSTEDNQFLTLSNTDFCEEMWDKLQILASNHNCDLQTRFHIQLPNFPRLSFAIYEGYAKEFIGKLVLCTCQPNVDQLEKIVMTELTSFYKLSEQEKELTYFRFSYAMKKWWEQKKEVGFLRKGDNVLSAIVRLGIHFDLKPPVTSFTGRKKELGDLHSILQRNDWDITNDVPRMVCICGLGGIGKSEMTRKYAEKYGECYDNNVVWINAESTETMAISFRKLCQDKLCIQTKNVHGLEKNIKSILEEVYCFFEKRKSLFVFDNAQCYGDEQHGYQDLCPKDFLQHSSLDHSGPYFIITSCNQSWPCKCLQLEELTEEDAAGFVKAILEKQGDQHNSHIQVQLLIKQLQSFPLALQLAVAYIAEKNKESKAFQSSFTIGDYLASLEDTDKKKEILNFQFPEHSSNIYTKTIYTTWQISMKNIKQSSDAMRILNIMAYFAPNDIPLNIFLGIVEESRLKYAVRTLEKYCLIRVFNGLANIHQLVQEVIRIQLEDKRRDKEVINDSLTLLQGIAEGQGIISHAVSAWTCACKHNVLLEKFPTFANKVVQLFVRAVRYEEGRLFGYKQLELLIPALGHNHQEVFNVTRSISETICCQGKYEEALQSYEELYERQVATLGSDHRDMLTTLHSIADVLYKQSKLDDAYEIFQEVLEKRRNIRGFDDPDTLKTRNSIACILHKKGKHDEALTRLTEVLEKRKELFGTDHDDTLLTMINVADVLTSLCKYREALQYCEEVYDKRAEMLGMEHPDTLTAKYKIACVSKRIGKTKKSLCFHEDVMNIRRRVLGPEHPDTLTSQVSTANELSDQDQCERAEHLYRGAFEMSSKVWGPHDEQTFSILHNIAEILFKQGNYAESIATLKDAMQKEAEEFGDVHATVLQTKFKICEIQYTDDKQSAATTAMCREVFEGYVHLMNTDERFILKTEFIIAEIWSSQQKYDKALEIYRQVYNVQNEIIDQYSEDTINTQKLIADTLYNQDEFEKALFHFTDAYEKQIRIYDTANKETLHTGYNIANVLDSLGRNIEASLVYDDVYCEQLRILGHEHEDTRNTCFHYADILHRLHKYEEAIEMFRKLYEIETEILGSDHEDVLGIQYNIADVMRSQGKYMDALNVFTNVFQKQSESLGFRHDDTLLTHGSIAAVSSNLNRYDDALLLYYEIFAIQREFLGLQHEDTLATNFNIADVLSSQEKYEEALVHLRDISTLQRESMGLQHEDTLSIESTIADTLSKLGRQNEALQCYEEIFTIQREFLGLQHEDTLQTCFGIAKTQEMLGQLTEAHIIYKEIYEMQCEVLGNHHPDMLLTLQMLKN